MPHLPALDGLRALAVIAVLLYHADLPVVGGYLGVEIFFVLSGFLITALLIGEWLQTNRIDLTAFWLRRARRLLPALLLVLAGVALLTQLLPPAERMGLGADLLAALGYVFNWRLVLSGQSYFDVGLRPSLLQHLWSLAVEEQFYLVWPLLFALALRWLRPAVILGGTLTLAAASAALAIALFDPGADPSRVYFGTDTRASGVLIGAALAMVWAPWRQARVAGARVGIALDVGGLLALAGLVVANLWMFASHPQLYKGGLTGVALLTALVIAAATHPRARLLAALLSWAPLRWVGLRSYGIYLWHWPIFQLTRPFIDVPFGGNAWLALRVGLVLLVAELSYQLVEVPVRQGRFLAQFRHWSTTRQHLARRVQQSLLGLVGAPQLVPIIDGGPAGSPFSPNSMQPSHSSPSPRPGGPKPSWRRLPVLMLCLVALTGSACASFIGQTPATPLPSTPSADAAAAAVTADPPSTPTVAASVTTPPTETPAPSETATTTATTSPTPLTAAEATASAEAGLPPVREEVAAALQAVLDRTVADGSIPGAVAAVNIPGYQTWVGAAGTAEPELGTPMTPDTRVRIASISKTFTAAVVLQLVEEGALRLEDPLSTWFPDLVPDAATITVRSLLQHTTGLYDYLEDRRYANLAYQQPGRQFTPGELVAHAAQFPPAFAANTPDAWDYSSTNFVILGMIVEQVTGNSLASEMRTRIFEPLGLEDTFFEPDEAVEEPYATGYSRGTMQRDVAMSFGYATANIVSTAADVTTFGRAVFAGELLGEEARDLMLSFVDGKGQYNMPSLAYGLGVMRYKLPVGRADEASIAFGHIGGFGGFRSALWHAPNSGITVSLGVNQGATDPNLVAAPLMDAALTGIGQ